MDIEFYIHGVPKGFDYVGPESERAYFATFYSGNKDEKTRLTVEPKKIEGRTFIYYNYLKYHNISDVSQRSGSYFGMTLRLDAYYADIIGIFSILNLLFHKFILHQMIDGDDESMKYIIERFSQKQDSIDKLKEALVGILKFSLSAHEVVPFESAVTTERRQSAEISMVDYSKESFRRLLTQHSRLSLSIDYPTERERKLIRQNEEKISEIKQAKAKEIDGLRRILDENSKVIEELSTKIHDLESTVSVQQGGSQRTGKQVSISQRIKTYFSSLFR